MIDPILEVVARFGENEGDACVQAFLAALPEAVRTNTTLMKWRLVGDDKDTPNYYVVLHGETAYVVSAEANPNHDELPYRTVVRLLEPGGVEPTSVVATVEPLTFGVGCVTAWLARAALALLPHQRAWAEADRRHEGEVGEVSNGSECWKVVLDGDKVSVQYGRAVQPDRGR